MSCHLVTKFDSDIISVRYLMISLTNLSINLFAISVFCLFMFVWLGMHSFESSGYKDFLKKNGSI